MEINNLFVPAVSFLFLSLIKVKSISAWSSSSDWEYPRYGTTLPWLFKYLRRVAGYKKRIFLWSWSRGGYRCPPINFTLASIWSRGQLLLSPLGLEYQQKHWKAWPRHNQRSNAKRSARFLILLIACRRRARTTSSCTIPSPLSGQSNRLQSCFFDFNDDLASSASIEFSTIPLTHTWVIQFTCRNLVGWDFWQFNNLWHSLLLYLFHRYILALLYHRSWDSLS